jgi:hypothetical protein
LSSGEERSHFAVDFIHLVYPVLVVLLYWRVTGTVAFVKDGKFRSVNR